MGHLLSLTAASFFRLEEKRNIFYPVEDQAYSFKHHLSLVNDSARFVVRQKIVLLKMTISFLKLSNLNRVKLEKQVSPLQEMPPKAEWMLYFKLWFVPTLDGGILPDDYSSSQLMPVLTWLEMVE